MTPEVMKINDVAAYLRIGRRTVYALLKTGGLPGRKVAGRWRVHLSDIEHWLRSYNGPPSTDGQPAHADEAANIELTNNCEKGTNQ